MKDPNILADSAITIGNTYVRLTVMLNEDRKQVLLIGVKPGKRSRGVANRVKDRGVDLLMVAVVEP